MTAPSPPTQNRIPVILLLLFYLALHVYLSGGLSRSGSPSEPGLLSPLEPTSFKFLILQLFDLLKLAAFRGLSFTPLTIFLTLLFPHGPLLRSALLRLVVPLAVVFPALALLAFEETGSPFGSPPLHRAILPVFGAWLGGFTGTHLVRGKRGLFLLGGKLALGTGLGIAGTVFLLSLTLSKNASPIEQITLSSADKHQLWERFQKMNPESITQGEKRILRLSEKELNLLLAWGAALLNQPERQVRLRLRGQEASAEATLRLPLGLRGGRRYLNARIQGTPKISEGSFSFEPHEVTIGVLPVPNWLAEAGLKVVLSAAMQDPRVRRMLDAVHRMEIEDGALVGTYRRAKLPPGFLTDLFRGATASDELRAAVSEQVRQIMETTSGLLRAGRQITVVECVRIAFSLAKVRSQNGDPVLENMAAVLSLGALLGHQRVGDLVGTITQLREVGYKEQRRLLEQIPLHGRRDLTRHFFVSASLTLLGGRAVSNAAGLLKEELDTEKGGSGFSFSDLLADRAGTLFAYRLSANETSARSIQEQLTHEFSESDLCPNPKGLADNLSQAELNARFGGVGGGGYRATVAEIDARLRTAAILRP